jgi:hypothetical protein
MSPDSPSPKVVTKSETSVSVESHEGAMYHALHVSRTVKTYPIQEHELYALDDLGGNSTLWAAICSASVTLLVSCVWGMLQTRPPNVISNGEKGFIALLAVIAVVSFLFSRSYSKKRKTRLERIMSECDR